MWKGGLQSEAGRKSTNNDIVRRVVPKDRRDNPGESTRGRSGSIARGVSMLFPERGEKRSEREGERLSSHLECCPETFSTVRLASDADNSGCLDSGVMS